MSGLEKIIDHIETSANETAKKLIDDANADAEKITASGRETTLAREAQIIKQAEKDVINARKKVESAATMYEKKILLQAKQTEVEDVLKEAIEVMNGLDDDMYFKLIYRILGKRAMAADAVVKFSARDLERIPADFEKTAAREAGGRAAFTVSKEPVDINGGFILDYGNIEENCSFDALISESKDELQDKIGQILFS